MKRDPEVLRQILLQIEEHDNVDLPDLPKQVYWYHLLQLQEQQFVRGVVVQEIMNGPPQVQQTMQYVRLTPKGHDFLDAIRDEGVWRKTKEKVSEVGGSVTFDVLVSVATYFVMQKLGLGK